VRGSQLSLFRAPFRKPLAGASVPFSVHHVPVMKPALRVSARFSHEEARLLRHDGHQLHQDEWAEHPTEVEERARAKSVAAEA